MSSLTAGAEERSRKSTEANLIQPSARPNPGSTLDLHDPEAQKISQQESRPRRATFLEGDDSFKRSRSIWRLDNPPPILTHLSAPSETFIIPNPIRALAIDFDGTIMNIRYSEGERQLAYRAAIRKLVKDEHDLDLTHEQVVSCHRAGVNNPEARMAELIAQELLERHEVPVTPAKLYAYWLRECEIRRTLHDLRHDRPVSSALVPGMNELIKAAKDRNIPVSVCTAGDNQFVEPLLMQTKIMPKLYQPANVFINRHADVNSKPSGDPYVRVAELLGVQPSEMLVLEDTATGALAALRAGANVLLQPSMDREQTIRNLLHQINKYHSDWLKERPGAVTVLSKNRGWWQVQFPT
ncbi:MAG: hypothetical protein RIS36_364 [Pseudomonadota bacterium]|jgi:beta-phosphoglucomutase-like phosphatase (HAD superfamily)